MDINFIIGLIISIALTYWGIWHANKSKSKVELSLIDQNWMPLITTHDDNINNLDIDNYKLPFNTNQYYYRGAIINTGNIDIYKSIILKPLKISFLEDLRIINFKLNKKASGMELKYEQLENTITFEWDIIKPIEHFSFELILESPKKHNFYKLPNKIKIDSRIANLQSVKRIKIWDIKSIKNKFVNESIPTYSFLFALLALAFWGLYNGIKSFYKEKGKLEYTIISKENKQQIDLGYYTKDSLSLFSNNTSKIIPIKDLNDKVEILTEIEIIKNRYPVVILSIISIFFIGLISFHLVKENIRDFQLKKILESL